MLQFKDIKNSEEIKTYIEKGNAVLGVLGYTEHGFSHSKKVSDLAADILKALNFDERTVELAKISGYMHDIGNCVNRHNHAQSGAVMAFRILDRMGMQPNELADVVGAIGNHDEGTGSAINPISAALILADKSDVRRTRVRNKSSLHTDIHDRVNFAVVHSALSIDAVNKKVLLDLTIDKEICAVMDYFEIFLSRMLMCRRAAEFLGLKFELVINKNALL